MTRNKVLIVEDDFLIALDVEQALTAAGFDVCGVASSEAEALQLAERLKPELAVVDISLSPGDGRVVAKALREGYATAVLFATGQCADVAGMSGTGAVACLPKPYQAGAVPAALEAVGQIAEGAASVTLPATVFSLAAS